jgi:hypothetical protein
MEDDLAPTRRSSFLRFWAAATISSFGSAVTAVAMPVLVVQSLGATPFAVGVVNAAQFVPYALLGLIAGVYTDRWRRKPVLVWASVGRALSLGSIPILWLAGALQVWTLVIALLLFGSFSVFGFAATQSLLPRLVPRAGLVRANARLDQTDAGAQTLGPALGGGLVGLLGAPVAIAVDAISYLVDAALNASVQVDEPRSDSSARRLRGAAVHVSPSHAGPVGGVDPRLVPRQWRRNDSALPFCFAVPWVLCSHFRVTVGGLWYRKPGRCVGGNLGSCSARIETGDHPRARCVPCRLASRSYRSCGPRRLCPPFHSAISPRARGRHFELERDGLLAGAHAGRASWSSERHETLSQPDDGCSRSCHSRLCSRTDR